MSADPKDMVILNATALVGYCESIRCGGQWSADSMNKWLQRLDHYVQKLAESIEYVYNGNESNVDHSEGK